ncbi:MAG: UDP-N-acetylmuramoyl-L-alanyl-D-glutamate--2,6-diaminopimelate ligase [Deltaproteobacteria bacterium]|nr:UDP-N-acetylmuramoyl-L-alanyl-D-glutamate--2,6-diaminopimelate ligase [Deltaproteobacteria bacterium]
MRLNDLLKNVDYTGDTKENPEITNLTISSKEVKPGSLFVALRGSKLDARNYIPQALAAGCSAILTTKDDFDWSEIARTPCPLIYATDIVLAKAQVGKNFYLKSADLDNYIGVTGTNGKTSICWIISQALSFLGAAASYLGTIGFCLHDREGNASLSEQTNTTTEDALSVYRFLGSALKQGARAAVMEVSSHALDQRRHGCIAWRGAVFTNLTRDHLDYHKTIEEYTAAKRKLFFSELAASGKENRFAVINVDDAYGEEILAELKSRYPMIRPIGYSMHEDKQYVALRSYQPTLFNTTISIMVNGEEINFVSHLVGSFNVSNMLAAAGVLSGLGYCNKDIALALARVRSAPGRLERIADKQIGVYVDYAHTPDGLAKAQESMREICQGRMITVFGCGGDRDKGKRPLMAQEVMRLSDIGVVTSDNPRTEEPQSIVDDILVGLKNKRSGFEYQVYVDRREAIEQAIKQARSGDIVLIAGKGHEDYQDVKGVKHHFSDQEICREILKAR